MPDLTSISMFLLSLSETCQELSEACADLSYQIYVSDSDVLALARAIQGEGAGLFGEEREALALWIAHTAYNRWEKPWWKRIDGVDCTFAARVEYDWHGIRNVAPENVELWALRIAHQVLMERRNGGTDQANGSLFAMTLDDLQHHDWTDQGREMLVHVIARPNRPLTQFWFMSGDPAEKETVL